MPLLRIRDGYRHDNTALVVSAQNGKYEDPAIVTTSPAMSEEAYSKVQSKNELCVCCNTDTTNPP
jgi:hypothetical protein